MKIKMIVAAIVALMISIPVTARAEEKKKSEATGEAAGIKLVRQPLDPFGSPRPAADAKNVPVRTSLYFELPREERKPARFAVTLEAKGRKPVRVLSSGGRFEPGFSGKVSETANERGHLLTAVYVEPAEALAPQTTYTVRVIGDSPQSGEARVPTRSEGTRGEDGWSFTTAAEVKQQNVDFRLDLAAPPVRWQGAFFSGMCNVAFCSALDGLEPSYAMMARDRSRFPKAWGMQRDLWLTGFEHVPESSLWPFRLPNIVRELQTRRIAAITPVPEGFLLKVEDFIGHEQYGIPAGRPLSEDYKKDYEVLIADGEKHVRAKVLAVDDAARTVLVVRFEMPKGAFKFDNPIRAMLAYKTNAPGRFPQGGCYLRRLSPLGTPQYYWGRLDAQWDMVVNRYGVRPIVNFCDAPGDLSATGKSWSPPKDFAQLHEVTRTITGHIIDRYGGERCLSFFWSIFNEPDLKGMFWLGTEEELYKYYDYATDAILRAFEDRGMDSAKVFIGGLEMAAPFPPLWQLDEFFQHCSPRGTTPHARNYAYADKRLDGKRSRRVESLCRAHGGKGSPVDFLSVHIYRASAMADLLTLAKTKALAIDPEYYGKLWACSHETCPTWAPPQGDESSSDVYLGNGYYPSWCADYMWRQLRQADKDPRYAMGNTVLTYWPWPSVITGVGQTCAATQIVRVDDNGDGRPDREPTIPMPIYNFLNLVGSLGDDFWVLPEKTVAGHTVSGFASRGSQQELRVLLYAHDPADLQVRAGQEFDVELSLSGLAGAVRAERYRFDRDHHSSYALAKKVRARSNAVLNADELRQMEQSVALKAESLGNVRLSEDGKLHLQASLAGNGVTFLVIQPD